MRNNPQTDIIRLYQDADPGKGRRTKRRARRPRHALTGIEEVRALLWRLPTKVGDPLGVGGATRGEAGVDLSDGKWREGRGKGREVGDEEVVARRVDLVVYEPQQARAEIAATKTRNSDLLMTTYYVLSTLNWFISKKL